MIEIDAMKKERDESKKQLYHTQTALIDAVREVKFVTKQFNAAQKQVVSFKRSYKSALADLTNLEEVCCDVEDKNTELTKILSSVENDLKNITEGNIY